MSFAFDASKSQVATTTTANAPTTSFTFGSLGAGDAGKPIGFSLTQTPAQNKPGAAPVFGTGASATPAQGTGFSFGTPAAAPTVAPINTSVPQTPILAFGTGTVASTGITPTATSTASPKLFCGPTTIGSTPSFTLGGTTTVTTTATPVSGFGAKPLTGGLSLSGGQPTSSVPTTGLTFGTPNTKATGTGFAVGTTAAGFPTNVKTGSTATGFTFGTGTTAVSTTGFALNKTSAAPSLTTPSTQLSLGTTTTVTSSANANHPASINSFEESINKWTLELEEQEKVFVNQAAQVNAWDKLLITNGEKIVALNEEVERVKIEQQQLEQELDYVVGQQKELQDCLVPLEKELASLSVSDPEREYTYRLAEDLDTQLKRMSEDLKEIIEHLNQANRTQDSSDPIVQIGKILNAHTNSLQWLDQQTSLLNHKIQQIDQMHQNFRQENERNFNLAYN
ncbi:nucleoporin 62 [Megalopta genalis]|uniref:nucleoporin 62 n=1 Tax=Megalopta genalis TaxID=115081 RepID=UPI0014437DF6|nr:nuclear pore glycoprotein p62 [Megalopta genalis]XP_033340678.1 nuclear pore glycoprotein p62 [Megalopta genalis]